MKLTIGVILLTASLAKAETIVCSLDGKLSGITRVDAGSEGLEKPESIFSKVTITNAKGKKHLSENYIASGILNRNEANFEIAPTLNSSPFGIEKAFIVYDGKTFTLEKRTYCNVSYQEETCSEGDLLDTASEIVHCSIDW